MVAHTDCHRSCAAGDHIAAHKGNVGVVGYALLPVVDMGRLFHRFTLSGETGLADKQVLCLQNANIAGIISLPDRWTMSPTTRSSMGISTFSCPFRVTVQVVVIMASSFSAALPLRDSWTKRRVPERMTMVRIITTVRQSKSSGTLPNKDR